MRRCGNCSAEFDSAFCPACGQKYRDGLPSLPELVQEVLGAIFSYDGKLWQTLRLLVARPGELTVRYVAGQRASFLGPLQLFLWLQAITFAAHTAYFDSSAARANQKSLALLVLGVWLAVVLWVTSLRERRVFAHALVTASHFWSFLMLLLLAEYVLTMPLVRILVRWGWVGGELPVGKWVTMVAIFVTTGYLFFGLRRVYGPSVWRFLIVVGSLVGGIGIVKDYL